MVELEPKDGCERNACLAAVGASWYYADKVKRVRGYGGYDDYGGYGTEMRGSTMRGGWALLYFVHMQQSRRCVEI